MKTGPILPLLFISLTGFSQVIKGKVIDTDTKQPVVGASVVVVGEAGRGTLSNTAGDFKLAALSVGRYSLKISSVGYESSIVNEVLVSVGKEVDLTVRLQENYKILHEVVVRANQEQVSNHMAMVSVKSFSVEQTKRYAATWEDPARMALSFAGTASMNDESNEIVIRGNSPKGLLWKLEGIEIPNPNHFSAEGASGGGISALSTTAVGNADFFTGAFPAEYGNATSGVFDIRLRKGNSDKRETSFQASFQGIELGIEGPFSKQNRASYLANYRYSTLGLFDKLGIKLPIGNAKPTFQDVVFKLHFPSLTKVVSVWGLGGLSATNYTNTEQIRQKQASNFYASGINYTQYINKNTYWESIVSASGTQNIDDYQVLSVSNPYQSNQNYYYQNLRGASLLNVKINPNNTFRIGGIYSHLSYSLLNKTLNGSRLTTVLDNRETSQLLQSYFQWKHRFSSVFSLSTGVHYMLHLLNDTFSVEPRLNGKWQMSSRSVISFGLGQHSRIEPIPTYWLNTIDNGLSTLPNIGLETPRSTHFVLGYEFRFHRHWRMAFETYWQQHWGVPIAANKLSNTRGQFTTYSGINDLDALLQIPLQNAGTGRNAGFELTIERFLSDGFYLLSTTSLVEAHYKGLDGIERKTRFSNGFIQNFLTGKEWKMGQADSNILGLNLKSTIAGGMRVIPIDLPQSNKTGTTVRDYTNIYGQQLANFFRTDLKISFSTNKKKHSGTYSLNLNNISNHKNPAGIRYSPSAKSIVTDYQLGLIPIFGYQLTF